MAEQRCAVVAVLGAPNAGKSTLVNALVGAKVAAVTQKVQTTRALVRGIAMLARFRPGGLADIGDDGNAVATTLIPLAALRVLP